MSITSKIKKKIKGTLSLQWQIIIMLAICWVVPLLIATIITLYFLSSNINKQIEKTVEISVESAVDMANTNLYSCIAASREASYVETLKGAYKTYFTIGDEWQLYHTTTDFLTHQYQYNNRFYSTVLYYAFDESRLYWAYQNSNSTNYEDTVKGFPEDSLPILAEEALTIDTATKFTTIDGRLYMIRNLVDVYNEYKTYATLIMDINIDTIFGGIIDIWNYEDCSIYVNKSLVMGNGNGIIEDALFSNEVTKNEYFTHDGKGYMVITDYIEGQRIDYVIALAADVFVSSEGAIHLIAIIWFFLTLPLIVVIFYFFSRFIAKPIHALIFAVKKIEQEEYGYQIDEGRFQQDFGFLAVGFNKMSRKLKKQFEQIYLEELALKDAKMNALQSQINPHFLNNTLEIINWEARMKKNDKVSGMIESLSIMLEATMNRNGDRIIPLEEELRYVDAYLFIIAQRFGKRLVITKEIDCELLECKVPKLIIQPIIENAVEHGIYAQSVGNIHLRIYREGHNMMIQIIDNGSLTEEDSKKIKLLLNDHKNHEHLGETSIGIRNVNSRLQIIYGEEYKLTIKSDKENNTVSTIVVKIDKD